MTNKPVIFCAIDTSDLQVACTMAAVIGPVTKGLKLGLEFFNAHGPQGIERIKKSCPDAALFLDLKFHDIPNTVAGAVRSICSNFSPSYLNVHASGGLEMMRAAKEACSKNTKLLAVTLLTSLDEQAVEQVGFRGGISARVEQFAFLSQQAGLDGVVCSAHEIALLRKACGPDFVLMVPGIRPPGEAMGDQKRVMTPKEAISRGATHLVIGRPITGAENPALAAQKILDDLKKEPAK